MLVLLILGSAAVSAYVGWKLTHPEPKPLTDSPDKHGIPFEPVQFASRNQDVTLKGWFLPASGVSDGSGGSGGSNAAKLNIIMAHGYRENRLQSGAEALKLAKELTAHGYNVLMFDFRNSGESGGSLTTVGYLEQFDLLGAIDWTRTHHPGKIALHGFSMGATASLLAAAKDPEIAGVVADSPFNHLTHYLEQNLPVWSHLPNFPFTPLILGILPPLTGIVTDQVDGLSAVDLIYPRPVLFIHTADDESIPLRNSESMWEKHADRFQLWKAPAGQSHGKAHAVLPKEYETRVLEFYNSLHP
ncbi:alpha/beta hydrolase [Paenibacillus piri]|uniref:alpha/beta hydrolase n=1 Tax=Paenibacillus piri TaxID=2547395 RepID=UPI001FE9BDBF|nr:alpha/beta hydrolase [Paenibacillus piri]